MCIRFMSLLLYCLLVALCVFILQQLSHYWEGFSCRPSLGTSLYLFPSLVLNKYIGSYFKPRFFEIWFDRLKCQIPVMFLTILSLVLCSLYNLSSLGVYLCITPCLAYTGCEQVYRWVNSDQECTQNCL